jgi:hypothetical protein
MERAYKRDGVDMTYLKNVILKLLQTGAYPFTAQIHISGLGLA